MNRIEYPSEAAISLRITNLKANINFWEKERVYCSIEEGREFTAKIAEAQQEINDLQNLARKQLSSKVNIDN